MIVRKKSFMLLAVCLLFISIIMGGCSNMQNKTTMDIPKYPNKPITIIVPFSAGGGTDMIARALEKSAPKYLGQPLIVVNKPGAAGTIAWNELSAANPDGYTIGISAIELLAQPLYGPTKYHYPTSLDPLLQISASSFVMVVQADEPWQDIASVVQYSKEHPGQLKFGHSGIGSLTHIVGETFANNAGIALQQVPFRGASESTAALLGKHIQILFINPIVVKEYLKNGTLKALAVSSEQRLKDPFLAQIPTFKEQGLNITFNNWFGVAAPKDLPPDVKMKLTEGFKAIISDPDFKINMDNLGVEIEYLDTQESKVQWLRDSENLTKAVQATGIINLIKNQKQ